MVESCLAAATATAATMPVLRSFFIMIKSGGADGGADGGSAGGDGGDEAPAMQTH